MGWEDMGLDGIFNQKSQPKFVQTTKTAKTASICRGFSPRPRTLNQERAHADSHRFWTYLLLSLLPDTLFSIIHPPLPGPFTPTLRNRDGEVMVEWRGVLEGEGVEVALPQNAAPISPEALLQSETVELFVPHASIARKGCLLRSVQDSNIIRVDPSQDYDPSPLFSVGSS